MVVAYCSDYTDCLTLTLLVCSARSGATSSRQAEELQRKALTGREAQLGASHPDTLISVNVLALILESQGKLEEARPRSGAER